MAVYGYDTDLANRLHYWLDPYGVAVVEVDGWQSRGRTYATFDPYGSVNHHTAGPREGDEPSLGICINGRSDLPGPLCNVHQARSPHVNLIAAGVANHAGSGGWSGLSGNQSVFGLEVEHCGYADEPFDEQRYETSCRVHAAFLSGLGTADPARQCQHYEWSTEGKIDFCHDLLDAQYGGSDGFRNRVAQLLASGPGADVPPYVPPTPTPPTPGGDAPPWPYPPADYLGQPSNDPHCHSGYYGGVDTDTVRTWQQRMSDRGWSIGVDGQYGPQSSSVCTQYQREKNLGVDGLVGPQTWSASWTEPIT